MRLVDDATVGAHLVLITAAGQGSERVERRSGPRVILVRESSLVKGSRENVVTGVKKLSRDVTGCAGDEGVSLGAARAGAARWTRWEMGKRGREERRIAAIGATVSGEGERRVGWNGGGARWDDAALKHSMEENAAGARKTKSARDTKTGVVVAVHTSS